MTRISNRSDVPVEDAVELTSRTVCGTVLCVSNPDPLFDIADDALQLTGGSSTDALDWPHNVSIVPEASIEGRGTSGHVGGVGNSRSNT